MSKPSVPLDAAEAVEASARYYWRIRNGLRGVAEWEAEAGALSREEVAAGEALLDRLLSGASSGLT